MIQYYYSDGIQEFGPYTLNDLREKALRPDFKIRTETSNYTATASAIPELDSLFNEQSSATTNYNKTHQKFENTTTQGSVKSNRDKLLIAVLIIWLLSSLASTIIVFILGSFSSYSTDNMYVFSGVLSLISSVLPLLVAVSIQDKNLKIVGIILALILTLQSVYGAIQLMSMSF